MHIYCDRGERGLDNLPICVTSFMNSLKRVKGQKKLIFIFQVLDFVDEHGNEVLNLGSFALLPQHVVRLIMARDDLKADEFSKFQVSS